MFLNAGPKFITATTLSTSHQKKLMDSKHSPGFSCLIPVAFHILSSFTGKDWI